MELIRSLSEKVKVMDNEFDFLKTELEKAEAKAKKLSIEKEALDTQLNELKEYQ